MSDNTREVPPLNRWQSGGANNKSPVRIMSMRVCESGALSVCGLSRFPVTLKKEQWLRLLDMADEIREFIAANEGLLMPHD